MRISKWFIPFAFSLLISPARSNDHNAWFGDPAADQRRGLVERALSLASVHGLDGRIFQLEAASEGDTNQGFEAKALRYVAIMAQGAVGPDVLGPNWAMPPVEVDARALLDQAIRTDGLETFLDSLPPHDPQYRLLTRALERYRALERRGGWPELNATPVEYENATAAVETLRNRLAIEGYLAGPGQTTASALRTFQFAHDLDVDGRMGPKTLAALNVPAAMRAAQIAANLERWRHLPRQVEERRIVVNIPGAYLDVMDDNQSVARMRVIDGDVEHPTPSFIARISAVTFNPPWNVPASIARKEILPHLKRRRSYLAEQNIIILNRPDDPFGYAINWRGYRRDYFPFQLRQQPGADNALGTLKFEMADPFDVYLHDTPTRALFARADRALSHGCVRVEKPVELAALLLGTHNTLDIAAAIERGDTRTIQLAQPIAVYVQYITVSVEPAGDVHFHPDIYGQDNALIDALGFSGSRVSRSISDRAADGPCA